MATDMTLSPYEKIGFPDSYRQGYEVAIFRDIRSKLTRLNERQQTVLDIGPGCAGLPHMLVDLCHSQGHALTFVDSAEMLAHLPDGAGISKVAGLYPDCISTLKSLIGSVDVLLCYSVLHYIFVEAAFWRFFDQSLSLLAPGGQMLVGDIPNVSKRKRFFASESGVRFHQNFMKTDERPETDFVVVEQDKIDDAVILGVVMRVRLQGCDAYWLPQAADLPMANRREDILIIKP